MIARILLWVLIVSCSHSIAWGLGAMMALKSSAPLVAEARAEGHVEIAESCLANKGFILTEEPDGKQWIFLCLHAPSGYMLTPDGEPIKPPTPESGERRYSRPKESRPF